MSMRVENASDRGAQQCVRPNPLGQLALFLLLSLLSISLFCAGSAIADHDIAPAPVPSVLDNVAPPASPAAVDYPEFGLPDELTYRLDADVAPSEADAQELLPRKLSPSAVQRRNRYTKIHYLRFDHVMELAGNDVHLKVRGPGKRKALMSVELKF